MWGELAPPTAPQERLYRGQPPRDAPGRSGRLIRGLPVHAAGVGGSGEVHEPAVQARVAGQLRMEGDGHEVPLARGDGPAVDLGQHVDVGTRPGDPRRADEGARDGAAVDALDLNLRLERGDLGTEGV